MSAISTKAAGTLDNKTKYSGKELQSKEFSDGSGLEEYDYGARFYDPQIGRWHVLDSLAEKHQELSTFNYVANNPIIHKEVDGRDFILVINTNFSGTSNPKTVHDFGNTSVSNSNPLAVSYNTKIQGYTEKLMHMSEGMQTKTSKLL